jgi:hypothetical protein
MLSASVVEAQGIKRRPREAGAGLTLTGNTLSVDDDGHDHALAATATALAANGANCVTSTEFAVGVDASGVAECEAIADADVPDTITIDNSTLAATATVATTSTVDAIGSDTTAHILVATDASGSLSVDTDPGITYDATNDDLTVVGDVAAATFNSGTLSGNNSGDDTTDYISEVELDTEAELESQLTDVTNVMTTNTGDFSSANLMTALSDEGSSSTYLNGGGTWDAPAPAADSLTWLHDDFSPTLASNEGMETDECQIVATATGACVLCEGSGKDDDEHQFCFPDIDPTDTTYNMLTSYDYGTPVNVGNAYVATLPGIDFTGADFSVVGTGKACLGGSEAGSFCTVDGDCAGSPAGVCTASKMATISLHANVLKTTSTDVMLESTDNVMDDAKHICLGAGSDGCLESNGTDVDVTGGFDMSAATIQIPSNSTPSVSVVGEIEVDSDDGTLHIYSDAEHKYYPGRGRQVFTTTNWIWGGDTVLTNGNDIYPMVNAIWSGSSANETFSQQLVKAGMVCHDLYVDTPGCTWDGTTVLTAGFRDDASTVLSCTISSGTTCDSGVSTATVVSGSKINFFLQCDGVDCPPDGTYCNPNMNVICDLD